MSNQLNSDSFEDDGGLESQPSSELELSEEQYSSYYDLLKQALKENRNVGMYLKPNYYEKLGQGQKLAQRIYRVQRRKDVIRDDYSLSVGYTRGILDRNIVKSFSFGLKFFKKLKLRLELLSEPVMMTNWIRILQRKHLPNLKTLVLDPSSSEVFQAKERRFPFLRSRCINIENLKIVFNQVHGRNNISIEDFTLRLIRGIHKLKNLCLDFYACAFIKDEHLCIIAKALRSGLYHLESLEMRLGAVRSHLTAQGIANLWKSLDKIPNLKKLELTGDYGRRTDFVVDYKAFVTLCDAIQRKSATLIELKINFGSSELGYKAHQYLCKALGDLLPRLHHLELKFCHEKSTSDDSLPLLGDLFSIGSSSLKTLLLDFHSCYGITSKGGQEFAERMKKGSFPAMESFWICFHYIPKLRYDGLYAIAEAIAVAFPNLEELIFWSELNTIRYSEDNYKLNDNEIKKRAEAIIMKKLKNLPKNFRLGWCE